MAVVAGVLGAAGRALVAAQDCIAGARLSILIFHRVLEQPDPLFPGELDAARFDRLCARLARDWRVLTLGQAVALRAQGRLPPRALCISFDDGYADNATVALPILQRHGLAATFFVATGFLDGGRMWNDTVIESLRRSPQPWVDLRAQDLGRWPLGSVAERRAAIDAVLPRIKYLPLAAREPLLRELIAAAGCPPLPDALMMRSAQVRALADAGMEIGGHTVRHPILTELPDAQARAEIGDGRVRLQQISAQAVEVFAYPNGGPDRDYDQRHVAMVRALGFQAAVSTAAGVAGADADVWQLPHFTPWDRGDARWALRLLARRVGSAAHQRARDGD